MLFSVFYVGDSCQGWGREFESLFPLQILKGPYRQIRAFFLLILKEFYLFQLSYLIYCDGF